MASLLKLSKERREHEHLQHHFLLRNPAFQVSEHQPSPFTLGPGCPKKRVYYLVMLTSHSNLGKTLPSARRLEKYWDWS